MNTERHAAENLSKLLVEAGYPRDRFAEEVVLRNGRRADFVIYSESAPLPLAIIELKLGNELANEEHLTNQLLAYSESVDPGVDIFLALFSSEKNEYRFFLFNRLDRSIQETGLPNYGSLNVTTKAAFLSEDLTAKRHASIQLKVVTWGIVPAIVISYGVLDALQIYSLSFERLILVGILFVSLIMPSVREVKIGEYALSLLEKQENNGKADH